DHLTPETKEHLLNQTCSSGDRSKAVPSIGKILLNAGGFGEIPIAKLGAQCSCCAHLSDLTFRRRSGCRPHSKCDARAVEIESIYGGNQDWLLIVQLLALSFEPLALG